MREKTNKFKVDPNSEYAQRLRREPPEYLTPSEGAVLSTLGDRTFREKLYSKEIKSIKLGGRVVVRLVDLRRYLERRAV